MGRVGALGVAATLALFVGGVAHAQGAPAARADPAAARAAYDEGKALFEAGKTAEACAKLEQSQTLDPQMRTQYGLADCYEKLGRTATAWRTFSAVIATAHAAGMKEHEEFAQKRAAALEPKLARISIVLPGAASLQGLQVLVDGAAEQAWQQPIAVDPGVHTITIKARERRDWSRSVEAPGEGKSIAVNVPALEPLAAPPKPSAPLPPRASAAPVATPPAAQPRSALRTTGIVVGALGVVGLGAGGVLGLLAKSRFNDSASHCTGSYCDPVGLAIRSDAQDRGNVATAVFVAGGVIAAVGITLFVLAPSSKQAEERKAISIHVQPMGFATRMTW